MALDAVDHKLAAILSADVVGYSRLMSMDEATTVRTLNAYREQMAVLIRQYRGQGKTVRSLRPMNDNTRGMTEALSFLPDHR